MIVTTVVTGPHEAAAEGATTSLGGAGQWDELLDRLAALEATFSLIRDARDFNLLEQSEANRGPRDAGSYFALTAEIKRLQDLAKVAREAEASKVISWIRRNIANYALTRKDLGI